MPDEEGAVDDCAPGIDYADDDLFQGEEATRSKGGPRGSTSSFPTPDRTKTRGRARQEAQPPETGADPLTTNLGIGKSDWEPERTTS
eukprot:13401880-Heterocapsa_arctica.AAC.1